MRDLKITMKGPGDIKPQEPPSYWEDEVKDPFCEECEETMVKVKESYAWAVWVCPVCEKNERVRRV